MPIFEYECSGCRERFELLVSGAEESGRACPRCGGTRLRRLLSSFAVMGRSSPRPGPCGSDDCACRGN